MKIRIKGNSIRYRLTRPEVEHFCSTGHLEEKTQFNGHTFSYALTSRPQLKGLEAGFDGNTITLYFPDSERGDWARSERVGFENSMRLKNLEELSLLVEKDFVCLDGTVEDQSDNYPNPLNKK
ncbi:MAG: hypothetical protein AAFO99_02150 [Bacteroidota bacterium]